MSMRLTVEQKKKQYRTIYEAIWEDPRIFAKDLALLLDCTPTAASNRLKEAYDSKYIIGPEIRKKSYKNLREYMYFINCKHPEHLYMNLREDQNVIYHAKTSGFCNLWVIAEEKIDVKGEIIFEGYRSDYQTSYASNSIWNNALKIMEEKINSFNPKFYKAMQFSRNYLNKAINWSIEDEFLYKYFKYNLRNNIKPIMKKHRISAEKVYNFFNNLPNTCTIHTSYYPDALSSYDPYLFMFETDYEDFIINLFSELPSSVSFFKVSNVLFLSTYIPRELARGADLQLSNKLYIPLLMVDLLERSVVRNKDYAIVEYSKGKDI
ncbi:MAG: hypothetical protein HXS54_10850 [Theionarchaea archaeon]|nr:hypothetical protein [Theionarchaea archaeon]